MFVAFQDAADDGRVDWMPSHASWELAVQLVRRSGEKVSEVDILANGLADALAKEQAMSGRIP